MAEKNSTILGRFLLNATNDMQQRIPAPDQGNIAQTVKALFDPMNGDVYNQFCDFMVNRIGYSFCRQQRWNNPLREFIKQKLYYGSTVTETQLNWIKGHSYNVDAEQQFKTHYPDGLQAFHSINSRRQYPISISREQMRQAVADDYGLNSLIASVMQQPLNADEYDMYNLMLDLFVKADNEYTLYRHHLTNEPTNEAGCKELLQAIQQFAFDLTVPTSIYSCVDLPVVVEKDEMYLFIRSDAMSATNVQALAVLFNLEKADIPYRTKVIPTNKWPLGDEDYAILTSSDFFQVYTSEYSTTSQWDAMGLKTNYWLNDWNTISFSPFVPVIVFSTKAQTDIQAVTMEPTTLTITADTTEIDVSNLTRYSKVAQITTQLNGTVDPDVASVKVAPDSVTWTYYYENSEDVENVNTRTYVDRDGILHIQHFKKNGVLTLTGTTTYINPDTGEASDIKQTIQFNIKVNNDVEPEPEPSLWEDSWEEESDEQLEQIRYLLNGAKCNIIHNENEGFSQGEGSVTVWYLVNHPLSDDVTVGDTLFMSEAWELPTKGALAYQVYNGEIIGTDKREREMKLSLTNKDGEIIELNRETFIQLMKDSNQEKPVVLKHNLINDGLYKE